MNTIQLSKELLNKGEVVAQGEIDIKKVDSLPKGVIKSKAENGVYILGHSESGHHHVVDAIPSVNFYTTEDPLVSYLEVVEATDEAEVILRHLRGYDTHQPIGFDAGIYEIINLVELGEDNLWRKAID